MSRRNNFIAYGLSLLWLYVVYRCIAGAIQGRPEWSLVGRWKNGGREIECCPDGSVRSDSASRLVTWQGSRFVFSEQELAFAVRQCKPDQFAWDMLLARQCGVVRSSDELLDGPHVKHQRVGETIEATVKWVSRNEFSLDGICYVRVEE
jgi:hypothetical protein